MSNTTYNPVKLCSRCDHTFRPSRKIVDCSIMTRENAIPSPEEQKRIDENLPAVDKELRFCQSEITRVEQVLESLTKRRLFLQTQKQSSLSLAAPIRRLFPEILEIIFTEVVKGNMELGFKHSTTGWAWMAPLNISAVCHHWRTIALSTTRLWSYITVVTAALREHDTAIPLQIDSTSRLETFAELSKETPLIVCVQHPNDHDYYYDASTYNSEKEKEDTMHAESLLLELFSFKDRFRYLFIQGDHGDATCNLRGDCSKLESLVLEPFGPDMEMDDEDGLLEQSCVAPGISSQCPKLRHIRTTNGFEALIERQQFPWSQITHLEIATNFNYTVTDLRSTFSQLKNLVHLSISCNDFCEGYADEQDSEYGSYDDDDGPVLKERRPVRLPSLKSFDMQCEGMTQSVLKAMLSLVDAKLERLAIMVKDEGEDDYLPTKALMASFKRFSHSLESLKLEWPSINSQQLIGILKHLHRLQSLEVIECGKKKGISTALAKAFAMPPGVGAPLLPSLHTLHFEKQEFFAPIVPLMLQVLRERLSNPYASRIRQFTLSNPPSRGAKIRFQEEKAIQILRAQGLLIKFDV